MTMRSGILDKLFFLAMFFSLVSCSFDPEKKLDAAIERYLERDPGAVEALALELIRYSSIDSIAGTDCISNGNVLYSVDENDARIIFPSRFELSMVGGDGIKHLDVSGNFAVASDERRLSLFDSGGGHLDDIEIGDEKNPLLNCVIYSDAVIYYRSFNLYRYSIRENEEVLLLKDTFPPPYTKYYTVTFLKKRNLLGIAAGIAGSYYFNIVNLDDKNVVLKNLRTSSSKIHMDSEYIYYIFGNSGAWQLTRWAFANKDKKIVYRFSDIIDIELTGRGYIWQDTNGLHASGYEEEPIPIPFPYQLAGSYGESILLRHGVYYYTIDMKKLLVALAKLREKAPNLFSKREGKEK